MRKSWVRIPFVPLSETNHLKNQCQQVLKAINVQFEKIKNFCYNNNVKNEKEKICRFSSAGRAFGLHPKGREFEPLSLYAEVAAITRKTGCPIDRDKSYKKFQRVRFPTCPPFWTGQQQELYEAYRPRGITPLRKEA